MTNTAQYVITNDDSPGMSWSARRRCFVSGFSGDFKIYPGLAYANKQANRLRIVGRRVTVKVWVSPAGPMPSIFNLGA